MIINIRTNGYNYKKNQFFRTPLLTNLEITFFCHFGIKFASSLENYLFTMKIQCKKCKI